MIDKDSPASDWLPIRPREPKEESETDLVTRIRAAINTSSYARVWRNNTGEVHDPGVCKACGARTGQRRHLIYGLAVGSADLIGIVKTQDGVGRMISIEVKKPGHEKDHPETLADQARWLAIVRMFGGAAIQVTTIADALSFVSRVHNGPA